MDIELESLKNKILDMDNVAENERHKRLEGRDTPTGGYSMIGSLRLNNCEELAIKCLEEDIPGDFVECGVWRGGVLMLWAALLEKYGDRSNNAPTRLVWGYDSFTGTPKTQDLVRFPLDAGDQQWRSHHLIVSETEVLAGFAALGLTTELVELVPGPFSETLVPWKHFDLFNPTEIAVLRLDCGTQEAYTLVLDAFYDRVSPGGFVIFDDYGCCSGGATKVVDELVERTGNTLVDIDWTGKYLRKMEGFGGS